MAVFRVEQNKGYTVMSNHHLRNKELSLKAKGLLSAAGNVVDRANYELVYSAPLASETSAGVFTGAKAAYPG